MREFVAGDYVTAEDVNEIRDERRNSGRGGGIAQVGTGGSYVPGPRYFLAKIVTEVGSGKYTAAVQAISGAGFTLSADGRTVDVQEINNKTGLAAGKVLFCYRWDSVNSFSWGV